MKAVQVAEFGLEHVKVVDVADPRPGQGEVLIATEAATITPQTSPSRPAPSRRLPWGSAPP